VSTIVVLIPVFNDPEGIVRTLDSLLVAERPTGTVTLVVDDGSEPPVDIDPSRYRDLHFEVVRLRWNQGIEGALNTGLAWARERGCSFVARLDSGDRIDARRLPLQLDFLRRNPDVGVVATDVLFVDEADRPLFTFRVPVDDAGIRRRMHLNSCLPHFSVMMRRTVLDQIGDYSTAYPAAEDYDLFFRILRGSKAAGMALPLVTTTHASRSISVQRRRRQLVSRLRLQRANFAAGVPQSYYGIAITMLLFLVPGSWIVAAKRLAGETWM